MATKKKATTKGIYNLTNMLKEKGLGSFKSVQGYTITTDSNPVHFFTALEKSKGKDTDDNVVLGHIQNGKISVGTKRHLGHANDCAYYDNGFYVAQGGGSTKDRTEIIELNNDLKFVRRYKYDGDLGRISYITYMQHGYFIMGNGKEVAICKRDKANVKFVQEARFELNVNDLKRTGCTREYQGAFYADGRLYRVCSYKNEKSSVITQNDIAEYKLRGISPSYSGATLENIYSCEISGKKFFEVESISSSDYGENMYVTANVTDGDGSENSRIYKVTL